MAVYALTGHDTIIINAVPLNDYGNGDIGAIEVPNDLYAMATGTDGNTIFALDESGVNATLTVKVLLSSRDDKRLNGLIPQPSNFPSTVLLTGSVVKQVGDGAGNISYNTFLLSGGMIRKVPEIKSNVNGDTEQAIVTYIINFANGKRAIA